jgi:septal ring factor EnvC (AmiA/AmiB activator)
MSSVVLATTHWDTTREGTAERRVFEDREKQLNEDFWKHLIDGGARPRRHENTPETALTILWEIVAKQTTATLKVQKEMNVDQLNLNETSAGREVNIELIKQQQQFEKEMKEIQKEMERAAEKQNKKYQEALAAEKAGFQKKLEDNIKMQKRLQQSAAQQMEERKALIEKLSAEVRNFKSLYREGREETSKLREEIAASQKAFQGAIAKASISSPTTGSSSSDGDAGIAAGMAMMIVAQTVAAAAVPAVLCNVM